MERRGKMLGQHHAPGTEQQGGPLHHVLEFPDIAGPGIALEHVHDGQREMRPAVAAPRRELAEKVRRQRQDVFLTLAQRRQEDGKDIEAVKEVAAKAALRHHPLEVAVGGGDDAHVRPQRLHAAQTLEDPFLEHAEQLGLRQERKLAHLVQKKGAPARQLEASLARLGRAGERAALVAEKLAFDQGLRKGRAIEGNERPPGARAGRVDGPGGQFLARARFSLQEDRGR